MCQAVLDFYHRGGYWYSSQTNEKTKASVCSKLKIGMIRSRVSSHSLHSFDIMTSGWSDLVSHPVGYGSVSCCPLQTHLASITGESNSLPYYHSSDTLAKSTVFQFMRANM